MEKEWKVILYEDANGCPINDFLYSLPKDEKEKIINAIEYLKEVGIGLRRPQGDYLRDGIYELRVALSGDKTRTLYFFCYETNIVLTHTFIKQTKKVPDKEIERAIKYREKYLQQNEKK